MMNAPGNTRFYRLPVPRVPVSLFYRQVNFSVGDPAIGEEETQVEADLGKLIVRYKDRDGQDVVRTPVLLGSMAYIDADPLFQTVSDFYFHEIVTPEAIGQEANFTRHISLIQVGNWSSQIEQKALHEADVDMCRMTVLPEQEHRRRRYIAAIQHLKYLLSTECPNSRPYEHKMYFSVIGEDGQSRVVIAYLDARAVMLPGGLVLHVPYEEEDRNAVDDPFLVEVFRRYVSVAQTVAEDQQAFFEAELRSLPCKDEDIREQFKSHFENRAKMDLQGVFKRRKELQIFLSEYRRRFYLLAQEYLEEFRKSQQEKIAVKKQKRQEEIEDRVQMRAVERAKEFVPKDLQPAWVWCFGKVSDFADLPMACQLTIALAVDMSLMDVHKAGDLCEELFEILPSASFEEFEEDEEDDVKLDVDEERFPDDDPDCCIGGMCVNLDDAEPEEDDLYE